MPLTYTCDIAFTLAATALTKSSGPAIADGQVRVFATSADTIKYSISSAHAPTDPPYASRTNTSGIFSSLVPGSYIVNARTNDSCKQEITIVIDYVSSWVPRWRVQHGTSDPDSEISFRVDIEDNQYVGDVSYVTATEEPEVLSHTNDAGDNVFEPVLGSQLEIHLISPTEDYFEVLNGYTEKRFRATYYQKINQSIVNGNFTGTLSPWGNVGSQTQSWAWNSNKARATTPSNFTTTKGLQVPFAAKAGVAYTFQISFDILIGAGSAGSSTNLLVYLTDDFTLSSPDNAEVFNLAVGAGQSQTFTITPTANRAYLVIATGNNASSSFGRIIDLDVITIPEIGYIQVWQGFIVPQNSEEEYCLLHNYAVTFVFSDGLSDLKNIPFTDDSGNNLSGRMSVLQGIIFCLNKTSLQLPIWETINFLSSGMDVGVADSCLTQCYFDAELYFDGQEMEDSLTVLKSLLTNFAARLVQSGGVWCIDCPTLKTGSVTSTRKFDYTGTYISSGQESYMVMLRKEGAVPPRVTFVDCSAMKSHQTMYGTLNFNFDYGLKINPSVIEGGDFEDQDIDNGQLTDWQIDQEVEIAVNPTIETVSRDNESVSKVLQINFDNFFTVSSYAGAEPRAIVSSKPVHFDFDASPTSTKMSLSFDVFVNAYSQQPYIFLDFTVYFNSVLSGDCYLAYDASVSTNNYSMVIGGLAPENVDGKYIRVYLEPGKWTTITADFIVSALDEGDLQMIFRASGNLQYDVNSIAALQAIATNGFTDEEANMRAGRDNRRRAFDNIYSAGINTVRQYILTAGAETPDGYNVVLPNDQIGPQEYYWKLDKVLTPDANLWAKNIQLDNVVLKYLPAGSEPAKTEESQIVLNRNVKNPLEITFRHGDLPTDGNYQNIMRGWLSLADGTPTRDWVYRISVPHTLPYTLIGLLKNIYQGQYKYDRWRLSGTLLCLEVISFIGVVVYEVRTGRIYTIVSSALMGKQPTMDVIMIESLKGPDTGPPVSTGDYALADYSSTDFYTTT